MRGELGQTVQSDREEEWEAQKAPQDSSLASTTKACNTKYQRLINNVQIYLPLKAIWTIGAVYCTFSAIQIWFKMLLTTISARYKYVLTFRNLI